MKTWTTVLSSLKSDSLSRQTRALLTSRSTCTRAGQSAGQCSPAAGPTTFRPGVNGLGHWPAAVCAITHLPTEGGGESVRRTSVQG
jgi:hypothetical protein